MSTRVFEYGLLPPTTNADIVDEQMLLAHRYKNKLIEIEKTRLAKVRALLASHPDVAELNAEIEPLQQELSTLREQIKARRQEAQNANTSVEVKRRVSEIKNALGPKYEALKEARQRAGKDATIAYEIEQWNEWAKTEQKRERAACGVYWGTYLLVEAAVDAARKSPNDPVFKSWRGNGAVGVQIPHGLPTADVHSPTNKHFFVEPLAGEGGKRRRQRTVLHIRVASQDREPVFATFPMMWSRPLPKGALVKSVKVIRRMFADKARYVVQMTVSIEDVVDDRPVVVLPTSKRRQVGVDVGWRRMDDGGIRVAVAVDGDGMEHELRLPADWVKKIEHARSIRAIRDRNLDEVSEEIAKWIEARGAAWNAQLAIDALPGLPEPHHVRQWARAKRVANFVDSYGHLLLDEQRDRLKAWVKQDIHLWQWEAFEFRRCDNQRKEMFRLFALKLAEQYSVVRLEKLDLRTFAKRGNPEDGATTDQRETNDNRVLANVSGFRIVLESAFKSRGKYVARLKAAWTTKKCSFCGHIDEWDARAHLKHVCSSCGMEWDQDVNAARNLAQAELPPDTFDAPVKKRGNRFTRAKEKAAAKKTAAA